MEKPKHLDQVRRLIRLKHYSIRTEEVYLNRNELEKSGVM
jgi:hypothetical protein